MERYFKVNSEFVACMLGISSELGYIIDEGLNPDSMEVIERANDRLATLLEQLVEEGGAA